MKKTLFSLALGALLLAAPRVASADVSVDFFYNNLSGGSWIEVADYGYCWQPDVAVSNSSWRPYADGYWAYTDLGWTWVSYEDFGWATYHYGRWARLADLGWVWVPGRDADLEWGPAWVSWRTGGEYIGWAPLPPETLTVYESRPLTGYLDVEYNIGPEYYNFCEVRYIGEPVLRERIVAPTYNITYIQQTVNVTNITYKNKTVYNYGPDINVVNRNAARPIQRLRLDREQNVDFATAAKTGGLTKVQGDRLVVGAPMRVSRPARQVAPPAIKTKVEAAKIDRGWGAVGDEKAQAEFKQKLKSQNRQNVAPLGTGAAAQSNAAAGANATGGTSAASPRPEAPAAAAGAATDTRRGAGRGEGKRRDRFPEPATQTSPNAAGAAAETGAAAAGGAATGAAVGAATSADESSASQGRGQGRGQRGQRGQQLQNATPPPSGAAAGANTEAATAAGDESQAGGGRGRQGRRAQSEGFRSDQNANPNPNAVQGGGNQGLGRQNRRSQSQPAETVPGDMAAPGQGQSDQGQGRGRRAERSQGTERGAGVQQDQGQGQGRQGERGQGANQGGAEAQQGQGRRAERGQDMNQGAGVQPGQGQGQGQGRRAERGQGAEAQPGQGQGRGRRQQQQPQQGAEASPAATPQ